MIAHHEHLPRVYLFDLSGAVVHEVQPTVVVVPTEKIVDNFLAKAIQEINYID